MVEVKRLIVLPGDFIKERKGEKLGKNVYVEGSNVFSRVIGILKLSENEIEVYPLSGKYMPMVGDKVVGIVKEVEVSGWLIDINSPYPAFLPLSEGVESFIDSRSDLSKFFGTNDIIFCKISRVTKNKIVQVSMRDFLARKLYSGIIIKVSPSKIPRIIGKAGSMINLIKNKTNCDIYTGQNGVIWIRGDEKAKAIEAILTIEKESHITGLTEKIEKLLSG